MFQPDFETVPRHEARESLAPLDEDDSLAVEQFVQPERRNLGLGVEPIQVYVVNPRAVFVNQGERWARHFVA